jgi:hypothetical protein
MHWLLDHTGALYLVLGASAVAFLAAFHLNRRVVHLGGAVGCLALMGLVWLLAQVVVTDSRQIERNVRTMARAVVAGSTDELFRYVARDFRFGTYNRDTLYGRVKKTVQVHHVDDIHIFEFEVVKLGRPQRQADVNFKATIHSADGTRIFLFRSGWVLEDDVWKIARLTMHNPLVDTDTPIGVP